MRYLYRTPEFFKQTLKFPLVFAVLVFGALLTSCESSDSSGNSDGDVNTTLPLLSVSDSSASEGNSGTSVIRFDVRLSSASDSVVSVDYELIEDTATGGVDFQSDSGVLEFSSGDLESFIDVRIIGDIEVEGDESFTLVLSSPVNAELTRSSVEGIILNDDVSDLPGLEERPDNLTCVAPETS